jgi:succinate dehydrogenase / fumarate reductase, flavoprotein subunit
VGELQGQREAREPGQQAQVQDHRRRHRPRRRLGGATLAELGYQVEAFTFHDSPRRAHSIAAQGGINAAKNYKGDGDSVHRLFYDTVKGGDFRAREANVHRLAEVSVDIIDQMVAQGVPFAREYGGLLDNRSFGGAQVSRTFYARGQTGQQLLLGAYQQMARQIGLGNVKLWNRIRARRRRRGRRSVRRHRHPRPHDRRGQSHALGARRRARHRRLRQRVLPVDQRHGVQRHRGLAGAPQGRLLREPLLHADPPDLHPAERRLPVEAHADVGVAAQRRSRVGAPTNPDETRPADQIPEDERDYYLERLYPSFGNLAPRDIASRAAKRAVDQGRGVGPLKNGVYLDFSDAINRLGKHVVEERYGNLFEMYERITGENPYKVPMRIYPGRRTTRWAGSGSTTS